MLSATLLATAAVVGAGVKDVINGCDPTCERGSNNCEGSCCCEVVDCCGGSCCGRAEGVGVEGAGELDRGLAVCTTALPGCGIGSMEGAEAVEGVVWALACMRAASEHSLVGDRSDPTPSCGKDVDWTGGGGIAAPPRGDATSIIALRTAAS